MLNPLMHSTVKFELFTTEDFSQSRLSEETYIQTSEQTEEKREEKQQDVLPRVTVGNRSDRMIS